MRECVRREAFPHTHYTVVHVERKSLQSEKPRSKITQCAVAIWKKCIHEKKNNVKEFDEFIQLKGGVKILAILVLCVVVVERAGNYTMHTQLNRDL